GHDRCLTCLGRAHAEAAFVDGSCAHCERMSMATLRRLPSSSSRDSSSSRKGFTAAMARRLGDLQVTVQNVLPGKTPRACAPPRGPVVMPKQTAPPSKSGPSVSFGAPPEEEMSISASEGEQSAGEAGASAEQRPPAVAVPSEADAELLAMLLRAAEGIGLEVPKVPPPDPSRLDDWFLGTRSAAPLRSPPVPFFPEVHDELVRAWRAPYSARSRPTSSALATLDGGAARGYEGVPQVERAVAVHLCPQDAATWRGSPRLPSKACRLSSALTGRAYRAAGQAATALHAMATLQVYQAKALKELHRGSPDQVVMQELRAATDLALRATKVTARSLGQVMSTHVVQERHLWLNLAQMANVDKARFLDAPVSQAGLFGDTDAPGAPMMRASPPDIVAAAGERRRPLADTGSPEIMEAALRGTRTSVPPLPEEGRDLLCVQPPSTYGKSSFSHLWANDNSQLSPAREPRMKTALQDVLPSGISCPTAGTSVNAPLIPLATRLAAWLELPSPSRWLIRTVRLGYAIQFARRPPKFRGILFTSVRSDTDASVLRAEIAVLLAKDAIEPVPPAEMKSGFYSPYFIVPKKSGRLQPILDLRVLKRSLLRLPFKMLTSKRILSCVRHQDWFAAIDLKDAYFHVSILPRHRPFLRFAFEGRAYQYKVLPFGLSLSPRVFTKVAEGALNPLWRKGIRILNYLDDWLIMAHLRDLLCEHRDLVLQHLSHLGLRVNREKSKLSPVQRISFLGMELDSVNMTACLTNERTQSVLSCLKSFRHKTAAPGAYGSRSRSNAARLASYAQTLCEIREDGEQVLLVAPHWPTRTCPSLEDPLEEGSSQGMGTIWHPRPDLWNLHAVIETITQQAYALRWGLFVDWCASRGEDPQRCPIAVVLSFLQEKLERRLSPSTLKVYVAAIAAYHDAVDGASIGKHQLVVRVNPPRPHLVPSWDLSVALRGLRGPPFEPLVSVELKFLSLKTALLTTLASIKRVGDLQAFSVNEACLEFGPADSHVVLRPRPMCPRFPPHPFGISVAVSRSFRRSEQLFVCFGGQQKGNAVSKQRLAHWVVDAISLAYESQGEPVASSYALAHGASLADICRAAGWVTPNTFARFYNLCVETVSSRVL
ncbi:hypothetical protein M9458_039512, partial [Cirrhinus mrigala]